MLALIAGQGRLPLYLADRLAQRGEAFDIYCLAGQEIDDPGRPYEVFRLEQLGTFIQTLVERGAGEVCLAGAIRRPEIVASLIDAATLPMVMTLQQAIAAGDDGALRRVISLFEDHGLRLRAAHEIAPELLLPASIPTRARPGPEHAGDLARAASALALLGQGDLGQGCVVAGGQVVALEAAPGTDFMLETLAATPFGGNGILVKAPKPGQDLRADMPTIGPATVAGASAAGLAGIVIVAGGVLVLDAPEVIAAADAAGLFLWVREAL